MTGSHEVRGSIPLGSTKFSIVQGHLWGWPWLFVPYGGARTLLLIVDRNVRNLLTLGIRGGSCDSTRLAIA